MTVPTIWPELSMAAGVPPAATPTRFVHLPPLYVDATPLTTPATTPESLMASAWLSLFAGTAAAVGQRAEIADGVGLRSSRGGEGDGQGESGNKIVQLM